MHNASLQKITILGAGLVGSLLAIYLARRGYKVTIFEKRPDMRKSLEAGGKSINLALSRRGWNSLEEVGLIDEARKIMLPMKGRMMHDLRGNLTFQPYGKEGEAIYSISREKLNDLLTTEAERLGAQVAFEQKCLDADLKNASVLLENLQTGQTSLVKSEIIIGADGAFSALRGAMQRSDRFNFSQFYIEHGYKEISIPPDKNGNFAMDPNALHIWPRGKFMLIALPNLDRSFTCTLFFPFEGPISFQALQKGQDISRFFEEIFPDTIPLMPDLVHEYLNNPTSSLVTIECFPWVKYGKALIVGDASHAIVPFYGQGMNAGFEDCHLLNKLTGDFEGDWPSILDSFQHHRKPDADAIAELALQNFVEMRDLVADPKFLLRKKIESKLHQLFPDKWVPLYSMITFTNTRYSEALAVGRKQAEIMEEVMQIPYIEEKWESLDFQAFVDRLGK